MTTKKVLLVGNQQLRKKALDISEFNIEFKRIAEDLKDTLTQLQKTKKIGKALAAPQIGYLKKVIYLQMPERTFLMVNPKIVWK
ncbi:MAG: peptide deformylase, partial [Candidatus Aenigmarchaeota archaeon]|nr:peptide deformylase [Candidatus Aenigmarchaeota archaeon]